ncbi:MAG: acetate kinase [Actinomycetales bacterium]
MGARTAVLVLNCGSSSVKLALIHPDDASRPISGLAERVGTGEATLRLDVDGERHLSTPTDPGHRGVLAEALDVCTRWAREHDTDIVAVGHRVVHGGKTFTESVLVDDEVLADVREVSPLAPLHNPANIAGIEAVRAELPDVPQVAVFDTAFHAHMPERAYRYAVPEDWYTEQHVRRYGFHGTSHFFVAGQAALVLDRPLADLRLVSAHLGNGCSVTAVRGGVSVDTSMGLTPLEGLVMGTRSGDLDPGILPYVESATGMTPAQVHTALNSASGLLGLSGSSNDMRTVRQHAEAGDERARLAIEVFCYRLAKYIASYLVALDGLDALVFTGGIGENDRDVRADVVARLGFLGLELDPDANDQPARPPGMLISTPGPVAAVVVPTDEELVIARDAIAAARPLGTPAG